MNATLRTAAFAAGMLAAASSAFAGHVTGRTAGPDCMKFRLDGGSPVAIHRDDTDAQGKWTLLNELAGAGADVKVIYYADQYGTVLNVTCNQGDAGFPHVFIVGE